MDESAGGPRFLSELMTIISGPGHDQPVLIVISSADLDVHASRVMIICDHGIRAKSPSRPGTPAAWTVLIMT
jgi:hypothetical protein